MQLSDYADWATIGSFILAAVAIVGGLFVGKALKRRSSQRANALGKNNTIMQNSSSNNAAESRQKARAIGSGNKINQK